MVDTVTLLLRMYQSLLDDSLVDLLEQKDLIEERCLGLAALFKLRVQLLVLVHQSIFELL